MSKPSNLTELTDQLADAFEMVKNDPRRMNQVREMANAAGKIINAVKVQIVYSLAKGEEPEIPWVGKTSGKPLKSSAKLISG